MYQEKSLFNPILYLKNKKQLSQYQCVICSKLSIYPIKCKGQKCKAIFCNQCAIDLKIQNNTCPFRCDFSNTLQLKIIDLQMKFECPFSSTCDYAIKSIKDFTNHSRTCLFINQADRARIKRKEQFKCHENHSLEIFNDLFNNLIHRKPCFQCGQELICRVVCRKCNKFYCNFCRPIPIYNKQCPAGHKFCNRDIKVMGYRCDICQLAPALFNLDSYDDFLCNFVICQLCCRNYLTFQKPVQYCQNLRNYCQYVGSKAVKIPPQSLQAKKHQLVILNQRVMQKCSWCQKQKLCYKKCIECNKYFCYMCKIFRLLGNNQCQFQHQFVQLDYIQENIQPKICYRCQKIDPKNAESLYFIDKICNVCLCAECYQYHRQYNSSIYSREVSIKYLCPHAGNHVPNYSNDQCYTNVICSICKRQMTLKLFCGLCPDQPAYCCKCLPTLDVLKCYCEKDLKDTTKQYLNDNLCLVCNNTFNQDVLGCSACSYTICKKCIQERINKNKKQQEINNQNVMESQHLQIIYQHQKCQKIQGFQ